MLKDAKRGFMEYYVLSQTGGREINEDCAGVAETDQGFCCILADGLGGHDHGEVASALVTDLGTTLFQETCQAGTVRLQDYLEQCFQKGQEELVALQKEKESEMKTTLVVLAAFGNQIQWGHVGDSRLYQFRNGRLVRRTLDHSVPQMLVMTGEIRERDIRGHEDRNRLLRVMGADEKRLRYELSEPEVWDEHQAYLLCTDGFWELIEEKQMVQALNVSETPRQWLEHMEQEVLKNGQGKNMDNYTAVGIFLGTEVRRKKFFGLF